jgi:glycosyltransferase involved in cell wall biosynthesis
MESVLASLSRSGVEVVLFAVDYRGGAHDLPFVVRPNEVPGDNYGVDQLPRLLEEFDPDVVLLHRNAPFFSMHRAALASFRARRPDSRVVVYSPADRPVRDLHAADLVVFYTKTGLETAGEELSSTAVIPHGVDHDRFFPVADARERLFGDRPELRDAFIVLNANRNERRKRVDVTMRGFSLFARDRPDAWLYLHMGMRDLGVDVPGLGDSLGIDDRLLLTWSEDRHPRVDDSQLNLIYNACDVGVNTAASEGWGLVAFEHAATGAAQVVPGHGACIELWRDAGVLLAVDADEHGQKVASAAAVADALGRLYDDRSLLAERSGRAYEHAGSDRFRWAVIAKQWEALLSGSATSS